MLKKFCRITNFQLYLHPHTSSSSRFNKQIFTASRGVESTGAPRPVGKTKLSGCATENFLTASSIVFNDDDEVDNNHGGIWLLQVIPYLDCHLAFPLLAHLFETSLFPTNEVIAAQYEGHQHIRLCIDFVRTDLSGDKVPSGRVFFSACCSNSNCRSL